MKWGWAHLFGAVWAFKTISRGIAASWGETPAPRAGGARGTAASRRAAGKDARPAPAPAVMAVEPEKDLPLPPLAGETVWTAAEKSPRAQRRC